MSYGANSGYAINPGPRLPARGSSPVVRGLGREWHCRELRQRQLALVAPGSSGSNESGIIGAVVYDVFINQGLISAR